MICAHIIAHLDALDLVVEVSWATTTVMANIAGVDIKSEHTLRSIQGYGATADEAIDQLWRNLTECERGDYVLIRQEGRRRVVGWNGVAFRDHTDAFPPQGEPT